MNSLNDAEIIKRISERLENLERRVELLEKASANIGDLKGVAHSIENKIEEIKKESSPISVLLVKKNYHQADYDLGDSGGRIDFTFRFTNHLSKDIRALMA